MVNISECYACTGMVFAPWWFLVVVLKLLLWCLVWWSVVWWGFFWVLGVVELCSLYVRRLL
ncbi:MAG: hypothetical protein QXE66_04755 [Desulfurococcaceae archaeon]